MTADVTITPGASAKTTTAFSPNPFTESIATQATVTWVNDDGVTHRVVSDAPLFDSGNLGSGDNYTFTFTAAGTYTYHCSIHPHMVGTITITRKRDARQSDQPWRMGMAPEALLPGGGAIEHPYPHPRCRPDRIGLGRAGTRAVGAAPEPRQDRAGGWCDRGQHSPSSRPS